jgi:hypothetical protein
LFTFLAKLISDIFVGRKSFLPTCSLALCIGETKTVATTTTSTTTAIKPIAITAAIFVLYIAGLQLSTFSAM